MKFLVLALCVCAASAATLGTYKPFQSAAKVAASPFVAAANVAASPFVAAAKAVVNAPAAVASAAKTAHSDAEAEIVSSVSNIDTDGSFNNEFATNNGISVQSSGSLKKVGDASAVVVTGSYTYYNNDGTPVVVRYVADENGYQPQSDSLPVGPPVPEDIARAVEYVLKNYKPEEQKY